LHLHPKWQRDVMARLPRIFNSCQFVITTHSPQVLGEVPARCVRLLILKEGRLVVETPAMSYGVDSNWILNVLMGADEMNQDVGRELDDISRLIQARELGAGKAKLVAL
jgi:predicted ATP-binding protein involved in virulence